MTGWRQLDLLKARNQRGTKAPRASEFATHCAVADTLRRWADPAWWWSHIGHGEKRAPDAAGRLKRLGLKPGMADFILLAPDQGVFFLELKRRPNKLSGEQMTFRDAALAAGARFEVAWSYEEAITILTGWGVLRRTLKVTA